MFKQNGINVAMHSERLLLYRTFKAWFHKQGLD